MLIRVWEKEIEKIDMGDELKEKLSEYKDFLNPKVVNYLNDLLSLNTSALGIELIKPDLDKLSQLDIYHRIVNYNIYNRALDLLSNDNFIIKSNDNGYGGLAIYMNNSEHTSLYNYDYSNSAITLYRVLHDDNINDKEMDRVLNRLESLYDEKNPYLSREGVYGGPDAYWYFEQASKVKGLEELLERLDSKKDLTEEEKEKIKVTNRIVDMMYQEYNLSSSGVSVDRMSSPDDSYLNEEKVTTKNNIKIKTKIKYI